MRIFLIDNLLAGSKKWPQQKNMISISNRKKWAWKVSRSLHLHIKSLSHARTLLRPDDVSFYRNKNHAHFFAAAAARRLWCETIKNEPLAENLVHYPFDAEKKSIHEPHSLGCLAVLYTQYTACTQPEPITLLTRSVCRNFIDPSFYSSTD